MSRFWSDKGTFDFDYNISVVFVQVVRGNQNQFVLDIERVRVSCR